ncbi:hypothetical protein GQ43DRAFT_395556 [Delitschia confertaspora ATCC 74209]|uniref:Inheritance of peroxisomes protein 1 n=1 Tax=Delitschia confertaspora ATCC 74209 TaxID=1513339 RepID=A0A9P4JJZ8_9PLEO|nr:hypothetical protein GQ43DRAFT_395556 [Delitschia confertaspora ATCC 74209]
MSSPAPSAAPGSAPSSSSVRRSFTVPARLSNRSTPSSPASRDSADGIETLFTHTFTKIISFTTGPSVTSQPTSSRRSSVDIGSETPESIPWKGYTERTLAVGPLRVYRVTSSNVSFLNSGNFLHTIFPKSQCWCVDGESQFVLRIRQNSYYRIELPFVTNEDKEKIKEFKDVLDKVLQYEKTPCPFARGFEVELPEAPKAAVRKHLTKKPEKAKKWLFDKTWVPSDGARSVIEESDSTATSSFEDDGRSSSHTAEINSQISEPPESVVESAPPQTASIPERARKFHALRSVTQPAETRSHSVSSSKPPDMPDLSKSYSPPHDPTESRETINSNLSPAADTVSLLSTTDTFYTCANTISRAPSPPYVDAQADIEDNPWASEHITQNLENEQEDNHLRGRTLHRRDISEITITGHSAEHSKEPAPITPTTEGRASSAPSTPPLVSDSDDSFEPPFLDVPTPPATIRLRRLTGASQRRAFSPMPQEQNLVRRQVDTPRKQLTAALVRKTCEIVLGPPAHLVTLMLRIAAKVSNGVFGFDTYRVRHPVEKIPCSWESSGDEGEWEEDDYGIPLTNLEGHALRRRDGNSP